MSCRHSAPSRCATSPREPASRSAASLSRGLAAPPSALAVLAGAVARALPRWWPVARLAAFWSLGFAVFGHGAGRALVASARAPPAPSGEGTSCPRFRTPQAGRAPRRRGRRRRFLGDATTAGWRWRRCTACRSRCISCRATGPPRHLGAPRESFRGRPRGGARSQQHAEGGPTGTGPASRGRERWTRPTGDQCGRCGHEQSSAAGGGLGLQGLRIPTQFRPTQALFRVPPPALAARRGRGGSGWRRQEFVVGPHWC